MRDVRSQIPRDVEESGSRGSVQPRGIARELFFWGPVLAGLGFLLAGMLYTVNLVVDDVFISFRYAGNLVSGHGLVFNPGERVEGFSNPLWTLLLAALFPRGDAGARDPFSLLVTAKLAGAVFGLATFVLLAIVAGRRRRAPTW